jgi:hypothetical protein
LLLLDLLLHRTAFDVMQHGAALFYMLCATVNPWIAMQPALI